MLLRNYQSRAIDDVTERINDRPILVSPTGSGKTCMAVELVKRLGLRTLWLAHRIELVEQARDTLQAMGLRVGIIKAGYAPDASAPVQVASVQTLVRRAMPIARIVVTDEAHHVCADTYGTILGHYSHAALVGLTATPFRLDGRGLGDVFGSIVVAARAKELCDAGILHEPKVWAAPTPDLRRIPIVAGDFNRGRLAEVMLDNTLVANIVETWKLRANGMRTVVFAVDIEHAKAIRDEFEGAGFYAEHLDGTTPSEERSAILQRLRDGSTRLVTNCMVLTEGWDLPALECAVVARPTASLNLHLQMIGRIMRACDGKSGAVVLDHACNHHRHGKVTRHIEYSLDSGVVVAESDPLGLRRCAECGFMYDPDLPACPECGHVHEPEPRKAAVVPIDGELYEFQPADFDERREAWIAWESQRIASGYQPDWSAFRYKQQYGSWPVTGIIDGQRELIDPTAATSREKEAVYRNFLTIARDKGYKDGWASHQYKAIFGVWPSGFVGSVKKDVPCRT